MPRRDNNIFQPLHPLFAVQQPYHFQRRQFFDDIYNSTAFIGYLLKRFVLKELLTQQTVDFAGW
ncbi:MAG TPA: hypothetical protein VJ729_09840 [Nitrososphaeraceae archaeon]|nr:hypothetical protein [Nitrososphaeraceae archaeon]